MLKFRESDFLEGVQRLVNNEQLLNFFKSRGVSVETLRTFRIGCDEEGNVICPVMNTKNVIIGRLTIYDIFNDEGGIYVYTIHGLVGNPKGDSVTVAKNIVDVCLLWQMGIDNPIIVSDREQTNFIITYKEINFVDASEDELVDMVHCSRYDYEVRDLQSYCAMHKELPEKTLLTDNALDYDLRTMPFVEDNRVFAMVTYQGMLRDSHGIGYKSYKVSDVVRRFKYKDNYIYFRKGLFFIPKTYKYKSKTIELQEVYQDVFEFIYTNLTFMSENQCRLLAMHIIYFWGFAAKHKIKVHAHIINPSFFQNNLIFRVFKELVPNIRNYGETPKVQIRPKHTSYIFYDVPDLIIDYCLNNENYDIGPKFMVNEFSYKDRTLDIKRVPFNQANRIREKLANVLFNHPKPVHPDRDEGLYYYYLPYYQVGLSMGMTWREVKDLFYTTCGTAQKVFRKTHLAYYVEKHCSNTDQDLTDETRPSFEKECKKLYLEIPRRKSPSEPER